MSIDKQHCQGKTNVGKLQLMFPHLSQTVFIHNIFYTPWAQCYTH